MARAEAFLDAVRLVAQQESTAPDVVLKALAMIARPNFRELGEWVDIDTLIYEANKILSKQGATP